MKVNSVGNSIAFRGESINENMGRVQDFACQGREKPKSDLPSRLIVAGAVAKPVLNVATGVVDRSEAKLVEIAGKVSKDFGTSFKPMPAKLKAGCKLAAIAAVAGGLLYGFVKDSDGNGRGDFLEGANALFGSWLS